MYGCGQLQTLRLCFCFFPGSPALTGTGTINVLVDDINDNVPTFASNMHFTEIPEDAPTGTDVLLVNASDADAAANAVIRYALGAVSTSFSPDLVFKLTQNDI